MRANSIRIVAFVGDRNGAPAQSTPFGNATNKANDAISPDISWRSMATRYERRMRQFARKNR